jgi:hypothetical protein
MNFKRLLTTSLGKILLSIILGLGLASLFRKVCNDKNCIHFNGPVISDIEGKIYKHGKKCYKYTAESEKCDSTKKIVQIGEKANEKGNHSYL